MFLLKNTTQWRWWGLNPQPLGLESSTLLLSHWAPYINDDVEDNIDDDVVLQLLKMMLVTVMIITLVPMELLVAVKRY